MNDLQKQDGKEYAKDTALVETVRQTIFPKSNDAELALFFYQCAQIGVHPLSKKLVPVKYDTKANGVTISFITSIDLQRSKAEETSRYDGQDEPLFVGEYEQEYTEDVWENGKLVETLNKVVTVPEECKVYVYKKDIARPFIGIARWVEYYPGQKKGTMWRQMPYHMLSKCAEALALRKAFPDQLHNLYTAEEMQRTIEALAEVDYKTKSGKPEVNPNEVKVTPRQQSTTQQPTSPANGTVGIVERVDIKTGSGTKGPWTKYGIVINKKTYGTFDRAAGELAQSMKGKKVVFTSKQEGNYENLLTISVYQEPVQSSAPEVMDSEEFEKLAFSLSIQAGLSVEQLNSGLFADFSCKDLQSVKPELQSSVIDWLTAKAETEGA